MTKPYPAFHQNNYQMNVDMIDGTQFLGCNLVPDPFVIKGCVCFWYEKEFKILPIDRVDRMSVYLEN